jgi:hypothetical protein
MTRSQARTRLAIMLVALAAAIAGGLITSSPAPAHSISGWSKVVDSKVNGLCGQGPRYVCATWAGFQGHYLYSSGHWRVYEVRYREVIPFSPWSARQCQADKVWVEHNTRIGSYTKASSCWK